MSVQILNDVPNGREPLQRLVWEFNLEDFFKGESEFQQPEPAELQIVGEPGCRCNPVISGSGGLLDCQDHPIQNGAVESDFHVPSPTSRLRDVSTSRIRVQGLVVA